jgi:V/A-type H+-transporting ATPase subunit K
MGAYAAAVGGNITWAALGLGLMFGLSGIGSAIGIVTAGNSVIGAIRKRPETFGVNLVLSALPSTQGLYGFVGYIIYSGYMSPHMTIYQAAIVFGAGVGLGAVNLYSGIKMGQVCASGITSIGSGHNVFGNTLVLAAFPEFYAILGLVTVILMGGLIK